MNLRNVVVAAVIAGASLVGGGVAQAAESTTSRPGGPAMRFLCELGGGYYYQGKYVSYCFYPDGTIVACHTDGSCVKYPPKEKNAATMTAEMGIAEVAR